MNVQLTSAREGIASACPYFAAMANYALRINALTAFVTSRLAIVMRATPALLTAALRVYALTH